MVAKGLKGTLNGTVYKKENKKLLLLFASVGRCEDSHPLQGHGDII